MPKRDKNSVSLAGESAVLSQLALQNLNASMTLGRTKGVDILISDPDKRMYRLEVKTTCQNRKKYERNSKDFGKFLDSWMMNKKNEEISDPTLFYCCVHIVDLEKEKTFRFFILPSKTLAKYMKENHQLLAQGGTETRQESQRHRHEVDANWVTGRRVSGGHAFSRELRE